MLKYGCLLIIRILFRTKDENISEKQSHRKTDENEKPKTVQTDTHSVYL